MAYLTTVVGGLSYAIVATTNQLAAFDPNAGVPSFAHGTSYVPSVTRAILHPGEAVLTAGENRQRLLGAGTPAPMLAPVTLNIYADMSDATIRKVSEAVEQAQTRAVQRWRGNVMGSRGTNP
jgi:hypothetical protein